MVTLYIIPGYGEKTSDQGYLELVQAGKQKGYRVVEVNPTWERNTIDKWLNEFNSVVEENEHSESVVVGFSFGAYICALSSANHHFKKIIFCSLSPYFKDDIGKLPAKATTLFGKRRINAFSKYEFPASINIPAIFMVGSADIPLVIERVKKSYNKWSGEKKLNVVKDAPHDISHPEYIKALIERI